MNTVETAFYDHQLLRPVTCGQNVWHPKGPFHFEVMTCIGNTGH